MTVDPTELREWDAVETRRRIAAREVSATEVVEAACARAVAARDLGAVVTETFARALREAKSARGPLAGVPTFLKDLAEVEGVRTAWGSASTGHWVSRRSDPIARAVAAAGLVSLGKSATPEFGLTATTEPAAFGPCRNPWDPSRSSGGSSGGAAALVAAGVVPIAHASDGGGSIRIPAACCGLVGLKVSRGRFDMPGSPLLPVNIAVEGVVTRSVRDTAAFWAAVEGGRGRGALPPIGVVGDAPARRLRIAVFTDAPRPTPVDADVRRAVLHAASVAGGLGHEVREIACPFPASVVEDFLRLWFFVGFMQAEAGRVLTHRGYDKARIEPLTRGFSRAFTRDRVAVMKAIVRLRGFGARYAELLGPWDVVVGPTLATPAPPIGHLATDVPFDEAIERLLAFTPFTGLVNAAGAPALSLPLGRSRGGLPIGVHLLARHGQERLLLELGGELEGAAPWARGGARG